MLQIQESYVNRTEGHRYGESGWYEPLYSEDRGRLYKALVKENGRCTGKVYVDVRTPAPDDGTTGAYIETAKPIGWVFTKRAKYEDEAGTYLRETWVTVRDNG